MTIRTEALNMNFYGLSSSTVKSQSAEVNLFGFSDRPTKDDEKAKTKAARERAIKAGKLKIIPAKTEKRIFGKDRVIPAKYEYTCNGRENLAMIKAKFGIKDEAIQKHLPWLKDDGHFPDNGYKIYFDVTDVE